MGNFIVTVTDKHNYIILEKSQGINYARIILAEPKSGLNFRLAKELCIQFIENGNIEDPLSLSTFVKSKRKKVRTAVIEKEFSGFETLQIAVFHKSNSTFKFRIDFVLNVK